MRSRYLINDLNARPGLSGGFVAAAGGEAQLRRWVRYQVALGNEDACEGARSSSFAASCLRVILPLALLFITALTLQAGMVVVQRVEGAGQSGDMTLKIQGDKIRADVSPAISMITDTASGSVITLMHPQKITLQMSVEAAAQLLGRVKSQGEPGQAQSEPAAKLHSTGKHESVNGIDTEIFTTAVGPVTATYWIAKDYPNGAKILDTLKRIQASAMGMLAKGVIGQVTEFPGVPVKTEMQLSPKQKVTATILSVTEQPLPDSDFIAPPDYKPLPSPIFGPGPGRP